MSITDRNPTRLILQAPDGQELVYALEPGRSVTLGRDAGNTIEQPALAAKDQPVDWLFDEGQLAYKNGRLLDAYRLLHGALLRDPAHQSSRTLLLGVMAERDL